jgi:hypothetical protein
MGNIRKCILVFSLLICSTRFYAQEYSLFLRVDSLFFALELEHFGNIFISSTISGMNKYPERDLNPHSDNGHRNLSPAGWKYLINIINSMI